MRSRIPDWCRLTDPIEAIVGAYMHDSQRTACKASYTVPRDWRKERFLQVEERLNVRQALLKNKDACTLEKLIRKK